MHTSAAEDSPHQPYNDMATHSFKRIFVRSPSEIFKLLPNPWWACLTIILVSFGTLAKAAEQPAGWRSAALMPWQLIGLDAEFTFRHREQLQSMLDRLKNAWLQSSMHLDEAAKAQNVVQSLNEQQLSRRILIGRSQSTLKLPHHLQPTICPVGDRLLMAIELISTNSSHLLAAEHISVPRTAWEQWQKPGPSPQTPEGPWQEAIDKLLENAKTVTEEVRDRSFKLKLGLLRGSHDGRKAAHLCLNMLIAHALAPKFTLLPLIGELQTIHLRKAWGIENPVVRATRELVLDWGMQPKGPQYEATGRWSEAVLGSSINRQLPVTIALDMTQHKLQLPNELIQSLQNEAISLKEDELPQVAKIHGAWAYLDRGRAWGLDMSDRLYLDDGQRLIKAHVVGFFGAGLGLKSPRGFPIHEGAILFIRTGQKKVKVGDSFRFDPTRFPTPWPPVRQPSQASAP
jgi:hypothetical protein